MNQIQIKATYNHQDLLGVCMFNIVPVRSLPGDRNELTTQLLFGETYKILEISDNGEWFKIRSLIDNYEGWIDFKQHTKIDAQEIEYFLKGYVLNESINTENNTLLEGSIVPDYQTNKVETLYEWVSKNKMLTQNSYSGNNFITLLKQIAEKYRYSPYLWGGKTKFGIDCSGLVQIIFRQLNILLPRDAYQQEELGQNIEFGEQKAGDLVFLTSKTQKVSHVGILMSEHSILHAHGHVREDKFDATGIYNNDRLCYTHNLYSIKRVHT